MTRYIDGDALRGAMMIVSLETGDTAGEKYIQMVEDMPAEDVVSVVRCKDCKFRDGIACKYSAIWVHPNGYCHWGRKENE